MKCLALTKALSGFILASGLITGMALAQDIDGKKGDMESSMKPMKETMQMMMPADAPVVPPVSGYSEGEKILFLHTEVSDSQIAQILTDMMGSPVLLVPSLANAPEAMLAKVYVFTNGVAPEGPKGPLLFQPDVFDNPPGDPGYSPLRTIVLVSWEESTTARVLTSARQVEEAVQAGEVTLEPAGVVVNMPMLTWPAGTR